MKKVQGVFILLSMLLWFACGGPSEEEKILKEASDLHIEAMKIQKEMQPELEQLQQLSNGIQIQGKELTAAEVAFIKKAKSLESRLTYWEDTHVEVPGFEDEEHDHSGHNHDHSHSHGETFNFTASDMLIIQKEYRDSIAAIKSRLGALLLNAPK